FILKDQFEIQTVLLIGAVMQGILFWLFPAKFAVVPMILGFLYTVIPTLQAILIPSANPYLKYTISGPTTALLPILPEGKTRYRIPPAASPQSHPCPSGTVVLHLGVRFNHPLGVLSPGGHDVGILFRDMNDKLEVSAREGTPDYGFLGLSHWRAAERAAKNTQMTVYFFRDLAGLRRFAAGPVHRDAMAWWDRVAARYPHIGIFHEVFAAPPGAWETMYANMAPTLLGAVSVPVEGGNRGEGKGDEKKGEFMSPLVDARGVGLRSMDQRMGRARD
ncbi:hypothetical protein ACRALDRAFT_2114016, partial [Sodiomyces alcalophilus JCM 7366]|uniref:uncharacterized protein n=1 Tax=Sodiomyces alcalophilus JCM 7366 TaxID=591952 RepID=UPI0039B63C7A